MSALSIQPTFPIFTETNGLPLENGYIWIGAANLDPQGNPISVYWDAALTIPAGQPIRTLNGYPSRSGTPARMYVDSDYSIRVQDSKGSLVYSAPQATEQYSDTVLTGLNAEDVAYDPPFTGGVQTNVEAKLAQTVSVKDFGVVGDGVTDDTVNFEKAIRTGQIVNLSGETVLITGPISNSGSTIITGQGTLKFAVAATTAITCTGDVDIQGNIVMDGTDVSNELIRATGSRFVLAVTEVKNIFQDNATGVRPILIGNVDYIRISGVMFTKIGTPANGVIGDARGACQGIVINGSCNSGKIYNCRFDDINNRATPGGTLQFEDADAILCATTSLKQNISVTNCEFENIGKRFFKTTGTADSVYRFSENDMSSQYVGTTDTVGALGNGMFSAFSCYGGNAVATSNVFIGGVINFFIDCDFANFSSAIVTNNKFSPEIHKYSNTSLTRFVNTGTTVSANSTLKVDNNDSINTTLGVTSNTLFNIITNNRIDSGGVGVDLVKGGYFAITSNIITQSSSAVWNVVSDAAYGAIIRNQVISGTGNGNAFDGKYDAWNIPAQTNPCRIGLSGNAYMNLNRNELTNNAAAGYVTHFANAGSTTVLYSSINAQISTIATAGAATALPATPLGYERIMINGVQAKIPYYAV